MMEFKIEKGIPPPGGINGIGLTAALRKMVVGDSFLLAITHNLTPAGVGSSV